jgi:N utilization substance protein A
MLDIKTVNKAVEQLAAEKNLDPKQIRDALEAALVSAYKKEYDKRGEVIRCELDAKTGNMKFHQIKTVVDETLVRFPVEGEEEVAEVPNPSSHEATEGEEEQLPLFNEERHMTLEEARKVKKDAQVGDELVFDLETPSLDFGRIAAQTAKQVIMQKLREIEKETVKKEFEDRVGELVSGTIQRIERGNVFVDLGRASGVMFFSEAIPGEHYRIGERLKFYLLNAQESGRGPNLLLSRGNPKFVVKLFELEVPEIADGVVQIKGIVREPGSRSKIAVATEADGVDPVGSCVGQRGARVLAVTSELGNEKTDIIEWSPEPEKYVAAALSPATVTAVERTGDREVRVLVPEDQLSLAIGKGGQNARLAAQLTGMKIDIRSQSRPEEEQEGGVAEGEEGDAVVPDEAEVSAEAEGKEEE